MCGCLLSGTELCMTGLSVNGYSQFHSDIQVVPLSMLFYLCSVGGVLHCDRRTYVFITTDNKSVLIII